MNYIVYKISNTINNKVYFGATKQTLKKRWQQHKCNHSKKNYYLYNAMKEYGFENFKIEEIYIAKSEKEMYEMEIELIKKFKSNFLEYGYNNSSGGKTPKLGCKLTDEQKMKISIFQKGRTKKPLSLETKLKIGNGNKNKIRSQEFKNKLSNLKKGTIAKNRKKVMLNNEIVFDSLTEASIKTGVSIGTITNSINGKFKNRKKLIWQYV